MLMPDNRIHKRDKNCCTGNDQNNGTKIKVKTSKKDLRHQKKTVCMSITNELRFAN